MALGTYVKNIRSAKKEYEKALKALGRKQIAQALGEVIPEGFVLVFRGWTPGFNDGEPCTFTTDGGLLCTEMAVVKTQTSPGGEEVETISEDEERDTFDSYEDSGVLELDYLDLRDKQLAWLKENAGLTQKAVKDLLAVWKPIDEDVRAKAFGTYGFEVQVRAGGKITVEDYDCGY